MGVARRITEIHAGMLAWAMLVAAGSVFGLPTTADATPVTTGLVFWLDADDQNSIEMADGKVSNWKNKVLNRQSDNVVQTNVNLMPTYTTDAGDGLAAAIRFNGTNQFLQNQDASTRLLTRDMTIFLLATSRRVDTRPYAMIAQGTSQSFVGTIPNGKLIYQVNNSGTTDVRSTADVVTPNQAFVFSITSAGSLATDTAFFFNGAAVTLDADALSAEPSAGLISIGNQPTYSRFFDGDIAEILIYGRVLDSTELADVENYLQAKIVPEPASVALLAGAGLAVAVARRRRVRG